MSDDLMVPVYILNSLAFIVIISGLIFGEWSIIDGILLVTTFLVDLLLFVVFLRIPERKMTPEEEAEWNEKIKKWREKSHVPSNTETEDQN